MSDAHYPAWLLARRAQRLLRAGALDAATALAMEARVLDPSGPLATTVIEALRSDLADALPPVDADPWVEAVDAIEGWLTVKEATLLARCVAAAPVNLSSTALEIGSYKGRSTVALALAITRLRSPLRLTAIDPHRDYHFGGGADTYATLIATLRAYGVEAVVEVVQERSTDVSLDGAVALAFIDGLHDRESVLDDYTHVSAHLVPGALLIFHDYRELFPGVVQTVNDVLLGMDYELAGWSDATIALRKVR